MRPCLSRERRRGFTRLRAVLAGGLVFGVGATVTLAAWTDEEFASGSLTAGTFSIVGSPNGTDFSDHPSAPGASLVFSLTPDAMTPGTTVYALYSVKTAPTSVAGSVQFTADAANGSGLGAYLSYGVNAISGTACNSSTFGAGSVVVGTGSALTAGAGAAIAVAAAGASVINYCFAVTLPTTTPNAAQGTALTAHWIFAATAD